MRLLDTNACIQLWQRKNLVLRERFTQFGPSEIAICSVVKAELLYGAMKSEQKEKNLQLLTRLFEPIHSFDFNDHCAFYYAQIRADLAQHGKMIGANDLMIAAIAMANKLTLVTHNIDEFERVPGLVIEDWEI
jgi:tRNA(fMet)-specific endonuclease VapC